MKQKLAVSSSPLKPAFDAARAEHIAEFLNTGNAETLLRALSNQMDSLIRDLFGTPALAVAVIATGGYGRRELFPHSDVDLLFLYDVSATGQLPKLVDAVLYPLWDMKITTGHATRTQEEALQFAKTNLNERTALLDARFICGDETLFNRFTERFTAEIMTGDELEFVEAKLKERDDRHVKIGTSRFMVEPNIKESKGGLRDLQTLYWLTQAVYGTRSLTELQKRGLLTPEEARNFKRAETFLWKLRAHLHLAAGRADEILTFGMQHRLAEPMGYGHPEPHQAVARLMKRYFLVATHVGSLTRTVCALLEMEKKRKPKRPLAQLMYHRWKLSKFILEGERLTTLKPDEFEKHPLRMMELFAVACEHGLDIHPRTLQAVTRNVKQVDKSFRNNPVACAQFMAILQHPEHMEKTLHVMNEVGLLGRFVPPFARITGQTQFNMYHIYTVDEHTIVAMNQLMRVRQGAFNDDLPIASKVVGLIQSPHVLTLALFCHDIAKGRGGDHSTMGESIAEKLALRFGFSQEDASTVAWLVEHHLLFSNTAHKRDLADPKTISDFVSAVQTIERLRLLLVLTVCDMRAVAPTVWNGWKASLLRELYARAEEFILTGTQTGNDAVTYPESMASYFALSNRSYASAFDATTHAAIANLLTKTEPFSIHLLHDAARGITECIIAAADENGLFSKLSAAFALAGASIMGAKIFTLKNGTAVDAFQIQTLDGQTFGDDAQLARLHGKLAQVLANSIDIESELKAKKPSYPTRKEQFSNAVQVFVDNDASNIYTVIEIATRDRVGLLYSITKTLSALGLSIASAHITTYGARAVDVFYVKDAFGHKLTHESKIQELKSALAEVNAGV
jgi:[protein-PII] uridylyltransferase